MASLCEAEVSEIEKVLFHVDLFVQVCSFLPWHKLIQLERVNKLFSAAIRQSEPCWREASAFLSRKVFVPKIVTRLLDERNNVYHRHDLLSLSIRELKQLASVYGVNLTKCFEKQDIVAVISSRELKKKLANECLARFALRIAYSDRKRNCITEDELCSFEWHIRVRGDGPLSQLMDNDPWWDYGPSGSTTVAFQLNGQARFMFNGPNAFEHFMGEANGSLTYTLERSGSIVLLSFGVREYVGRHPDNWGFLLASGGSVWTSFNMPKRGTDGLIEDGNIDALITSAGVNTGFQI